MNFEDYLNDAIELVGAWNLPDEEFASAVNDLARLMTGLNASDCGFSDGLSPYAALKF
jgi:hypothetical protein